jgi:hypothetical protein
MKYIFQPLTGKSVYSVVLFVDYRDIAIFTAGQDRFIIFVYDQRPKLE